ncbi:3-ketoacyl-CoA synthase [Gracilaria domingensis]|nr:3-ketoacyl-CoA synthase [Gracilaria domingensis]
MGRRHRGRGDVCAGPGVGRVEGGGSVCRTGERVVREGVHHEGGVRGDGQRVPQGARAEQRVRADAGAVRGGPGAEEEDAEAGEQAGAVAVDSGLARGGAAPFRNGTALLNAAQRHRRTPATHAQAATDGIPPAPPNYPPSEFARPPSPSPLCPCARAMPALDNASSTIRRRNAAERQPENGSTLYSLAESTRLAWERVRRLYATDPNARAYSFADVRRGYNSYDPFTSKKIVGALCCVLVATLVPDAYSKREHLARLANDLLRARIADIALASAVLAALVLVYNFRKPNPVYLIDVETFQPPERYHVGIDRFMKTTLASNKFDEDAIAFQKKLLGRSGIGSKSAFPASILEHCHSIPENNGDERAVCNMHFAREEAELVLFSCMDALLSRNNLDPKAIDLLVVNCSLFNPTPSLSAMLVNKYKMRSSVRTYNLAGMGCSAGLISVDLAKDLLQVHRNAICVVVSTENITQNWYLGRERSMLITNTLFRMGGAAVLLTNKKSEKSRARYMLKHTVRTHVGADDLAYDSIFQMEDKTGLRGVKLSKNIMDVAGGALKKNVTTLAPRVFPLTEHIKFGIYLLRKKVLGQDLEPYIPDFHRGAEADKAGRGGESVRVEAVRQHVLGIGVVRTEIPREYGAGTKGRSSVADCVRLRVQVQLCGVGMREERGGGTAHDFAGGIDGGSQRVKEDFELTFVNKARRQRETHRAARTHHTQITTHTRGCTHVHLFLGHCFCFKRNHLPKVRIPSSTYRAVAGKTQHKATKAKEAAHTPAWSEPLRTHRRATAPQEAGEPRRAMPLVGSTWERGGGDACRPWTRSLGAHRALAVERVERRREQQQRIWRAWICTCLLDFESWSPSGWTVDRRPRVHTGQRRLERSSPFSRRTESSAGRGG